MTMIFDTFFIFIQISQDKLENFRYLKNWNF